jgi:hypothetical protein
MKPYLLDHNPSERMRYPEDVDHLYREIVEGVYYPQISGVDSNICGYFLDTEDNEYITFNKNGFYTDAEWKSPSEELLDIQRYWESK